MTPFAQLRTFLETCRTRSLSRAAASLGITQPAASAHIRTLEEQVGRKLFRRHARGVEVTPAGEELAAAIASGFDGIEASFSSLRARSEAIAGTIRIAGPSEFMRACMAEPLSRLHAAGLAVRITLGGRELIYRALAGGDADLAVTASRPAKADIGYARIAEETLLPVAAPSWMERTIGRNGHLQDARAHAPVAYDEQLPLLAPLLEAAGADPAELQAGIVAPDLRMVRDLVEAGSGWSVLPDYLVADALRHRRLVELKSRGPKVTNRLYLAWPKAALRHPRVSYARQKLLEAFEQN